MAKLKKKFIEENAVDGSKIRLSNNEALRVRNAADNADIDLIKVNASDEIILASLPKVGGVDLATINDVGDALPTQAGNNGKFLTTDGSDASWGAIPATNAINELTGDVTAGPASGSESKAATIAAKAVTNAKIADMADKTIKGNNSGSANSPSDLSVSVVTSMLDGVVGDSGSGGTKGLVPAPGAGDAAANKFLKADGSWSVTPAAPTSFADDQFSVKNAGDATKQIKLNAASITTGTTRTITMPDSDVDLGEIATTKDKTDDLVTLSGVAANSTDLGTFTGITIADNSTVKASLQALETAVELTIPLSQKGASGGVATLDGGGKVPVAQLPASVMEYKGTWDADTNSPTLADGAGDAGDIYVVSVAGTQDLGSGNITFDAGDWVMYNGSVWEKSINSNAVASVNSKTGAVVLDTDDVSEGGTNQYFTETRARTAAVIDSLSGAETDQAPSVSAVSSALSYKQDSGSYIESLFGDISTITPGSGETYINDAVIYDKHVDSNAAIAYSKLNLNASIQGTDLASGFDSDDINEGSTNQYFTETRARDAVVLNNLLGNESNQSPSVSAVKTAISGLKRLSIIRLTLASEDITAKEITFSQKYVEDTIIITPIGGLMGDVGVDYTVDNSGATTVIKWTGKAFDGLLEAGDILVFQGSY